MTGMMLLITFDRYGVDQDCSQLHKEIKTASRWWHHLESTWIVCTDLTPAQWADRLRRHLNSSDHLLVVEIARNYDGWLPAEAWNWLHKQESSRAPQALSA